MTILPPRRLSADRSSPHYSTLSKHVDVYLNGIKRDSDVVEYNVDDGWIEFYERNDNGLFKRGADGKLLRSRLTGDVEVAWRESYKNIQRAAEAEQRRREQEVLQAGSRLAAAEAKRQRRIARNLKMS